MNYTKLYNKLITKYQNIISLEKTEKHHIIPLCMGGSNTKENLVSLPFKAHYVAHHLLCKMHPNNPKLFYAFSMMVASTKKHCRNLSARMYELARKATAGRTLSEEHRKNISIGLKKSSKTKGRKYPWLSERNRLRGGRKDAFKSYNDLKKLEGFTPEEIEKKRKAGKARKGKIMSAKGRENMKKAAQLRELRKKNLVDFT